MKRSTGLLSSARGETIRSVKKRRGEGQSHLGGPKKKGKISLAKKYPGKQEEIGPKSLVPGKQQRVKELNAHDSGQRLKMVFKK